MQAWHALLYRPPAPLLLFSPVLPSFGPLLGSDRHSLGSGMQQWVEGVTDLLRHLDLDLWVVRISVQHND